MSVLDREPTTKNFLSPLGFRFALNKAPDLNYFVQHIDIPDISIDPTVLPTPFNRISYPGSKATYGDLTVTFKVDEQMANFMFIYDWLSDISLQTDFQGYKDRTSGQPGAGGGVFSDATVVVMTSSYNPSKQVVFRNIYPTNLSGLTFDSTMGDVQYLQATATFAIQKYEIINA